MHSVKKWLAFLKMLIVYVMTRTVKLVKFSNVLSLPDSDLFLIAQLIFVMITMGAL